MRFYVIKLRTWITTSFQFKNNDKLSNYPHKIKKKTHVPFAFLHRDLRRNFISLQVIWSVTRPLFPPALPPLHSRRFSRIRRNTCVRASIRHERRQTLKCVPRFIRFKSRKIMTKITYCYFIFTLLISLLLGSLKLLLLLLLLLLYYYKRRSSTKELGGYKY